MPGVWSENAAVLQFQTSGQRERAIGRVASDQKQLIRSDQLIQLGLSPSGIRHRVLAGRLHLIHRSVYATHPGPYSRQQLWLAATYACGPGSALSDWCAAAHLALTEEPPLTSHVTNATGAGRGLAGVTVHRRALAPGDAIWHKGIVTTTAARTIVDCAHSAGLDGTEELIMAADSIQLLNRRRLEELAEEHRGRPGTKHVLVLISDDPAELRSVNERRMFSICREFGIERPVTNHRIDVGGRHFVADFCWPHLSLIVEADSWRWHGGRLARERDADRDQLLSIAGWRVVHFTRRQIKRQRIQTGRRLVALTRG